MSSGARRPSWLAAALLASLSAGGCFFDGEGGAALAACDRFCGCDPSAAFPAQRRACVEDCTADAVDVDDACLACIASLTCSQIHGDDPGPCREACTDADDEGGSDEFLVHRAGRVGSDLAPPHP